MNLNQNSPLPFNIHSSAHQQKAVDAFNKWAMETKEKFTEGKVYNPTKAFVRFFAEHLMNFELDEEKLRAINELAQMIKDQKKIDNPDAFHIPFTMESFLQSEQEIIDRDMIDGLYNAMVQHWHQKGKQYFEVDGKHNPTQAFVVMVSLKIPTLAEMNALAEKWNAHEGRAATYLITAPYRYGDVQRIIGEITADRAALQKAVDLFDGYREEFGHHKKYFVGGWYSPSAALLGFLREKGEIGENGLLNYGHFCIFAQMVKNQRKIENNNQLKDPPCSYNDFYQAYITMFVRSGQIYPNLTKLMLYVVVPLQLLLIVYAIVRSFDKSLDILQVKNISAHWTPAQQANVLLSAPYTTPFKKFLKCVKTSDCSEEFFHAIDYAANPLVSSYDWCLDRFLGPRNANMTVYLNHQEGNCSLATLFYCAEKHNYNVTGIGRPGPLLLTNGSADACESEDEEFGCTAVQSQR